MSRQKKLINGKWVEVEDDVSPSLQASTAPSEDEKLNQERQALKDEGTVMQGQMGSMIEMHPGEEPRTFTAEQWKQRNNALMERAYTSDPAIRAVVEREKKESLRAAAIDKIQAGLTVQQVVDELVQGDVDKQNQEYEKMLAEMPQEMPSQETPMEDRKVSPAELFASTALGGQSPYLDKTLKEKAIVAGTVAAGGGAALSVPTLAGMSTANAASAVATASSVAQLGIAGKITAGLATTAASFFTANRGLNLAQKSLSDATSSLSQNKQAINDIIGAVKDGSIPYHEAKGMIEQYKQYIAEDERSVQFIINSSVLSYVTGGKSVKTAYRKYRETDLPLAELELESARQQAMVKQARARYGL